VTPDPCPHCAAGRAMQLRLAERIYVCYEIFARLAVKGRKATVTTTDELRAAAERIVSAWEAMRADMDPVDCAIEPWDVTFARLWLEEHPADDGAAVDQAWLRAVGFREPINFGSGPVLGFGSGGGRLSVWCRFESGGTILIVELAEGAELVTRSPTRGHVRALLRALGVPPTEAGPR
jgi:hypothetical protein